MIFQKRSGVNVATGESEKQREAKEREEKNRLREEKFKLVSLYHPDQGSWPRSVRAVGPKELDNLGIDRKGQLYWDGKPIQTQNRIRLNGWQALFGIMAALATVGLFAIESLRFFGIEAP